MRLLTLYDQIIGGIKCLRGSTLFLLLISIDVSAQTVNARQATRDFISANWQHAIHHHTTDSGTLIGLPKPYSVPGTGASFQEMYYWDTYFTNIGLIKDGWVEQAKNNVDNMVYLVNRYGFMPNGNRTFFLVRSQPPYLSMMVRDVYEQTKDKQWLKQVVPALEKEYQFWMAKRISATGLNRYGEMANADRKRSMFISADKRLGITKSVGNLSDSMKIIWGAHLIAECESGWDFTPRFDSQCESYNPVDLNSNLYVYEINFAFFNNELKKKSETDWLAIAAKRKELLRKFCLNKKDGLYYDYNYVTNQLSPVYSAAVFNIAWAGIASQEEAQFMQKNLSKLETAHGIVACEAGTRRFRYQWDRPNGWANLQYMAIHGLDRYGFKEEAKRIASKYVDVVANNFSRTNNLWEKYNMEDGTLNATNEYGLPALMGWTAGVYVYSLDYTTQK